MKIKLITIFALTFLSFSMNGQKVVWSRFKFGIHASPTISWLKTDNAKIGNNGFNTGLKLGATADYYFLENYALTTGIGFGFNQGGKLFHEYGGNFLANSTLSDERYNTPSATVKALPDQVSIRYHIQYVEIPLALKMRTQISGEHLRAFAQAPVIVIGWRSQVRGDISAQNLSLEKENIKQDVNPLSLSWGLGGGIEYMHNQNTSLVAGLFYQRGFVDTTRDKNNYSITPTAGKADETSKAVLNAITLRLGVIF